MRMQWKSDESTLVSIAEYDSDHVHFQLIAEPLPQRSEWLWIVWRRDYIDMTVRYGKVPSISLAMANAEDVANDWDATECPGDGTCPNPVRLSADVEA
jgi:hypothetical protein